MINLKRFSNIDGVALLKSSGNELTLSAFFITTGLLVASGVFLVTQVKALKISSEEAIPDAIPIVHLEITPYDGNRYKQIVSKITPRPGVMVEAEGNKIKVVSDSVNDEFERQWRNEIEGLLRSNKELSVSRICGGSQASCGNHLLHAEITGEGVSMASRH